MKRRKTPLRDRSTNPDRRRRAREKKRRQMGDDTGLAAWIRMQPCAACAPRFWDQSNGFEFGQRGESPSIVAHIRTRAAGHGVFDRDGNPNVIPLCQTHHGEQHSIGWARFERRYRFSATAAARIVAVGWDAAKADYE